MKPAICLILSALLSSVLPAQPEDRNITTDVVVYGGTPAGITAAIAAAKRGQRVALIDINKHVGGMVSGGLVDTDMGDRKTVGGLSDDFFKRIVAYYRGKYGAASPQFEDCHDGVKFEPHVAELVYENMLKEQPGIQLWREHRYRSVALEGGRIASISVDDLAGKVTRTFSGGIFIDASYEGDVMAGAMVPYRVGRESRAEFGEYLAGVNMGPEDQLGLGDHRTQAYNYRVSITPDTANRVLFPKPENYDPEPWRGTSGRRVIERGLPGFAALYVNAAAKAGPNQKLDTNWGDLKGGSEGYANGDWETRDRIAAKHRDYFLSMLYYLQNDPELPAGFRENAMTWGLPKDEFADNGHFPFQLYIREGRRMMGRYILREQDLTQSRYKPDGICTGSYGIDCHVVQTILHRGAEVAEHTRHVSVDNYDIPYSSITPIEPANLLVPVCISATHVAYASLRMEPVYMMLGQAAGEAAHLALTGKTSVQDVSVTKLRGNLIEQGAVLDAGYQPQVKIAWTPAHPAMGELVRFHVASAELKDPIKQVWWDLTGDGTIASRSQSFEHRFTTDKLHTVSLVVEDRVGRRRLISAEIPVGSAAGRDVTMDEFDADLSGKWTGTYPEIALEQGKRIPDIHFGPGIHRDVVVRSQKAPVRAVFKADLPKPGRYKVCLGFRPSKSQATNLPVAITQAGTVSRQVVDQTVGEGPFNFTPLGEFRSSGGADLPVEITNDKTDGLIAIDAVRWVWMGD